MDCSQELSEFKRVTVIGCHLCNKSIREISLLPNIPWSTVCGIITNVMQSIGYSGESTPPLDSRAVETCSLE
ncbi:unnamed protein product [Staurois parvus]|uniref:Uncharacterized protein n=1 Tax=Staurois parvus TaxID=386267 RepID=A0ABN9C3Z2_9NEOB|nr:unnamed protein product [Staurois parvus]